MLYTVYPELGAEEAYLEGVDDSSLDQILVCVGGCIVAVVRLCIALQQLSYNDCTLHAYMGHHHNQ